MDTGAKSTFQKILQGRDSARKPCWPNPEDSTGDIYANCKFGGRSCWEARGPVRERFQVLAPDIREYLIAHSDPVSKPVTWTIYMIGTSRNSSRPTIMFCSEDKASRNAVRNRVKDSGLLKNYPGFDTGACSQEFRRYAADVEMDYGSSEIKEFCVMYDRSEIGPGMFVYFKSTEADATWCRKARCGGIIVNEGKYFLQTVAHVFEQEFDAQTIPAIPQDENNFEYELDDDDDVDVDVREEEVDICSRGSATPENEAMRMSYSESDLSTSSEASPQSTESTDSLNFSTLRIEHRIEFEITEEGSGLLSPLSTLKASYILTQDFRIDLDYCLIDIPQSELGYFQDFINHSQSGMKLGCPKEVACSGPQDIAVSLIRGDDSLDGKMSGTPTFIMLPGIHSILEVWVVRHGGALSQGDCGSWVIDAIGETLYGHVVAGDPKLAIAYVVPTYLVFENLRSMFGGSWHLASKKHRSNSVDWKPIVPENGNSAHQEQKTTTLGGEDGSFPSMADQVARTRLRRACWRCRLLKFKCIGAQDKEICYHCSKTTSEPHIIPCNRERFHEYAPQFFPESIYSQFTEIHMRELATKYLSDTHLTTSAVDVSLSNAFKPMNVRVQIYRPKFAWTSMSSADNAPIYLNESILLNRTCASHIDSMIRSANFAAQTTVNNSSALFMEACKRYSDTSSGSQSSLVAEALKMHALEYTMTNLFTFTAESGRRICEIVQDPAMDGQPYTSSRVLDRQIKYYMQILLRETVQNVLRGLEKSMRTKSNLAWAESFCAILILSLCVESVQVSIVRHELSLERGDTNSSLKQTFDAYSSLEENPYRIPILIFHGIYRSRRGKSGFNPLLNPEIQGLDPAAMQMLGSIRTIISYSADEMKVLADEPMLRLEDLSTDIRITGRLAANFLISFFPEGWLPPTRTAAQSSAKEIYFSVAKASTQILPSPCQGDKDGVNAVGSANNSHIVEISGEWNEHKVRELASDYYQDQESRERN